MEFEPFFIIHPLILVSWIAAAIYCAVSKQVPRGVPAVFGIFTALGSLVGYVISWMYWGLHRYSQGVVYPNALDLIMLVGLGIAFGVLVGAVAAGLFKGLQLLHLLPRTH